LANEMQKEHGAFAFLIFDEEKRKLWVKKSLEKGFASTTYFDFDPSKPAPAFTKWSDYLIESDVKKYTFMNKYSFTLLQNLQWSRKILLYFQTAKEAIKVTYK